MMDLEMKDAMAKVEKRYTDVCKSRNAADALLLRVSELHEDLDGNCTQCSHAYPCPTVCLIDWGSSE